MSFLFWTWACNQLKPTTGQQITFKIKTRHLNELYTWAHDTVRWHWLADAFFDSCQYWPYMDVHKDVHYQGKHRLSWTAALDT